MQKLLFVLLLLILPLGLRAQPVARPRPGSLPPDGKPGLPLPAARFPDETPRLLRPTIDSSMLTKIRELPEIPGLPGKPVPAMEFPDEKYLHGIEFDSPEMQMRDGYLLQQRGTEAKRKSSKMTDTKK